MSWVVLDMAKVKEQEVFEGTEQEARAIAETLNEGTFCAHRSGGTFYWPARYAVAEATTV